MPINPNIAMSYRGIQLENPVNMLAQIEALKGARQQNALGAIQMQRAQQEMQQAEEYRNALQGAIRASTIPENAPGDGMGPTMPGRFDFGTFANRLATVDPMKSLQVQGMLRKEAPQEEYKVVGGSLVRIGPSGVSEAYRAPEKPDKEALSPIARLLRERDQLPQGDPRRAVYDRAIAKDTTHSPGTTVNVNATKPLINEIAGGLGKQVDQSFGNAQAAVGAISTAQNLMRAVDSGKLIAGPGASFRVLGLQIGQMLGVGGKDGAEVLANTRTAIQSMAQSELDAAQQMRGQGQITEAERDIIRRAASGNIDGLTAPEVKLLAQAMEKTARSKLKRHQSNVEALRRIPEAAPLLQLYNVDEPPAYAPSAGPAVRRYNPATGKIE